MGKITVFALDDCPFCKKVKELLTSKGVSFDVISLTQQPEWKSLMFLLTKGRSSVPEVFLGDQLLGGYDEIQALEASGKLDTLLAECVEAPHFPPPLRTPSNEEYLQLIPTELREKWQSDLEGLNEPLGGTADNPISSLLVMLNVPTEMIVLCTAGPGSDIFKVGAGAEKGSQGGEEKLYCQVAIEESATLFLDGPEHFPAGLKDNEDYKKFGYGYYLGAPWSVGQLKGTVVAMETRPGILKESHILIIEALRDKIQAEFTSYLAN